MCNSPVVAALTFISTLLLSLNLSGYNVVVVVFMTKSGWIQSGMQTLSLMLTIAALPQVKNSRMKLRQLTWF